ncbi:MAG TPA: cupin domain-containing protein [Novosphingobium sp.]
MSAPCDTPPPFAIFRARDAKDYGAEAPMTPAGLTESQVEGSMRLIEAGMLEGSRIKLLYSRPGMSLTWCWFKSGFPLPRHSHSADCLYYVVAGTLRLGSEELGAGDGFFLGSDVPYTYVPGENGVEVLEFRTSDRFDIRVLADSPAYWDKALATLLAARPHWPDEAAPPSGAVVGH